MLALTLLACTDPTMPAQPDVQPDLVLILANGLREDTDSDGATAQLIETTGVTPGWRFTAAYSQTVQPYTAMGSMLTGRYPSAIPLCSRPARSDQDAAVPFCVEIPAEKPTMAEVLRLYGYRTALITVDASALTPLARGFEETISVGGGALEAAWSDASTQAADWWSRAEGSPRLLVVAGQFHTMELEGAASVAHTTMAMTEAERAAYLAENPWFNERMSEGMSWPIVTDASREMAREAYEDTARRVGTQVKGLLGALAWSRPRWTVLTALHGLTLGEDSGCRSPEQLRVGSHIVLLDRTLRVPLLVYGPTQAERTEIVDEPVELLDLLPTFAALAGAVPPAALSGSDLMKPADPDGIAYAEFGDMLSLRHRGTMLTFRSQLHGVTSADPRLTDRLRGTAPLSLTGEPEQMLSPGRAPYHEYLMHEVAQDPLQTTMLPVGEDSARFMELLEKLLRHRTGPAAPPTGELSWEEIQELRRDGALHYW
ncbi:MAG: arylsulfatase A-like enzyme [Myxococcota bacterium]|jgi:arylsulfatase A-like enzyme